MNLEIMLINSNEKNLYPKWVWCGDLSSHRCVDVVTPDLWTCGFHLLRNMVDFILLLDIYCFLFWVGRWYLLSTRVLYWPLLVCFLSLLYVECSKHTVVFNSTATLASLHYSEFQGELMLLAWTGSSSSCLDALKFRHGLAFYVF